MGNTLPWVSPVNAVPKDGTTLAEIVVPNIRDVPLVAGLMPEDFVPVSIVPLKSMSKCCCCPLCCVSIPTGFAAIVSRFGADVAGKGGYMSPPKLDDGGNEILGTEEFIKDGTWSAGFHCFWPWYSVNRLVSRQLIIFDTPVKDCKTKDNITVNIDVLIVLEILKADAFVYGLGPEKLDSLLRASQEEVLRQVAFTIPVENIYDLHGHDTEAWVTAMNKNFEPFGVVIHHFTVKNVEIPGVMAKDFEDKTLYESKTIEKKVQQLSDRMALNNEEERQKLKEECENARMAAEEQAVTTKAQIVKEVREVLASTDKDMGVLEAQRLAEVADLQATSDLEVAKLNAKILAKERSSKATIEADVGKLEAEAEAYDASKKALGRKEASQKIAMGKKAIAQEEGAAVEAFAARRQQEQEMARLDILDKLSNNQRIQIATSLENNMGLAPNNSLVSQVAQQGIEAFRMKLAEMTASSVAKLDMGTKLAGGLVRPVPQQMM